MHLTAGNSIPDEENGKNISNSKHDNNDICVIKFNYPTNFTKRDAFSIFDFWICEIFEEFLIVLTQSFQADVHNPKSRSAMECSLPVCANYIFRK